MDPVIIWYGMDHVVHNLFHGQFPPRYLIAAIRMMMMMMECIRFGGGSGIGNGRDVMIESVISIVAAMVVVVVVRLLL